MGLAALLEDVTVRAQHGFGEFVRVVAHHVVRVDKIALDDVEISELERFERELLAFADAHAGSLLARIAEKKALDDDIRNDLKKTMTEFKERFAADGAAAR